MSEAQDIVNNVEERLRATFIARIDNYRKSMRKNGELPMMWMVTLAEWCCLQYNSMRTKDVMEIKFIPREANKGEESRDNKQTARDKEENCEKRGEHSLTDNMANMGLNITGGK